MKKILFIIFFFFLSASPALAGFTYGDPPLSNGLISYWRMDESSGQGVGDYTGTNNGTAIGTTIDTTGKVGYSRSFTGTGNYITIPYNQSLNTTASFSLSVWIKPTQTSGSGFIFGRGKDQAGEYRLRQSGRSIMFQMNSSGWWSHTSSLALNIGVWNHAVVVFDYQTQNIRMYINGVQVLSETETHNLPANTLTAVIGADGINLADWFSGGIDEVGLWNRALSTGEITNLYNNGNGDTLCLASNTVNITGNFPNAPNNTIKACTNTNLCSTPPTGKYFSVGDPPLSTNLVSYWKMDETSGQTVTDYVGSNNGSAAGATVATGKISNGRDFNGSSYINIPYSSSINIYPSITLAGWIKPSATNYDGFIVSRGKDAVGEYRFYQSNTSIGFKWNTSGGWGGVHQANASLQPGVWTHVAVTIDQPNKRLKLYANGNQILSDNLNGNEASGLSGNSLAFTIGREGGGSGAYFKGIIDELGVWNRALSAGEIANLYNNNNGNTISFGAQIPTAYSISVPVNTNYILTGDPATGYTVSYSPGQNVSVACGNVSGPTITYASCTPVNGTWGEPYGTCIDGTQTMTCNGTSCGGTCPGPGTRSCTMPIYDAGIVSSGSTIDSGAGKISQSGGAPGFNLQNYTINPDVTIPVSYSSLLTAVAKNAGAGNNFDAICDSQKTYTALPGYTIYCYTQSSFFSFLQTAAANTVTTNVLYPALGFSVGPISNPVTINSKTVIFANGNLAAGANVTVGNSGGAVFVTNGNVTVDPAVTRLDGVYVFTGNFDDGVSASQLRGNGSLLGIGAGTFNFSRTYPDTSGPAEAWTYEPKYLVLFKNILATASYTWKELPPQ